MAKKETEELKEELKKLQKETSLMREIWNANFQPIEIFESKLNFSEYEIDKKNNELDR